VRILAIAAATLVAAAACGGGAAPVAQRAATCPASVVFDGSADDHGSLSVTGTSADVQAGDSFFAPTCLTGVRSGAITLHVKNTGALLHNFSVPSQSIDVDIPPGQTITVTLKVGSGDLHYFCKYHRTVGMLGAVIPQGR
jgi:plastocyanin